MQEELIATIVNWNPLLAGTIESTTPLITSSLIDSLNLVRLSMWIERSIGRPVDVTAVNIRGEWDDVASIVQFVQRRRAGA